MMFSYYAIPNLRICIDHGRPEILMEEQGYLRTYVHGHSNNIRSQNLTLSGHNMTNLINLQLLFQNLLVSDYNPTVFYICSYSLIEFAHLKKT